MNNIKKIFSVAVAMLFLFQISDAQTGKKKNTTKNKKTNTTKAVLADDTQPSLTCPCNFPPLEFENKKATLSEKAKTQLKNVAKVTKENPQAVVFVNLISASTKSGQQNCFQRIQHIIQYLAEQQGISFDRIVTNCDMLETSSSSKADILSTNMVLIKCDLH